MTTLKLKMENVELASSNLKAVEVLTFSVKPKEGDTFRFNGLIWKVFGQPKGNLMAALAKDTIAPDREISGMWEWRVE